ncbi:Lrp/AsnC family transcriptional regulator [Pelosinus sp. sgz500959]|uniref:Lrp/AsnC family transcriptional regulator n=1 Tax=Pelosinus sp. sgz500959 TaxID=3242472 RepID=UPI00366E964B
MIDHTDQQILKCLQQDSRMQWQEIGKIVHLTGQAVATRIRRMQDDGIIEAFTITLNYEKLCKPISAFITVFMNSSNHTPFRIFIENHSAVVEAHRISGEGCYWLKITIADQKELSEFLDGILLYGNYRVNLSIDKIK